MAFLFHKIGIRSQILNQNEEIRKKITNIPEKVKRKKLTYGVTEMPTNNNKKLIIPDILEKSSEKLQNPNEYKKDPIIEMKISNSEENLKQESKIPEFKPISEIEVEKIKEKKSNREKEMNELLISKFSSELLKCMKMTVDEIISKKKK